MPYENTRLIKEDVLFRGGEQLAGSQYDAKVIEYLNRVYFALASGASEFIPEYVDDWWWLRAKGSLLIEPVYDTGLASVLRGSATVTLNHSPAISLAGRRFIVDGVADQFVISAHTAGSPTLTLDLAYTGPDNPEARYEAMRVSYPLSSGVAAMIGPMRLYREPWVINGLTPEALDDKYPPAFLAAGSPMAFCLEDERTVRFSHGGLADGTSMRVDYHYRPIVSALTDDTSSLPLVPAQWRHVLSDMALTLLLIDKNDDRSTAIATAARAGIAGMIKENRRRFLKIDRGMAHIYPRP